MISVKVRTRYVIAGADYSAQEPRVMTQLSGDPHLKETFEKDRDPYATMIAPAVHKDYWECMEHYEDGTPNPEGKNIRKKGKTLMLGISYGMGAKNMSKSMKLPVEECKKILETFYENFPKIKQFTENNLKFMNEHGYVEDYMGRRRHLEDALLPEIEVVQEKSVKTDADKFIDISDKESVVNIPDEETIKIWTEKWNNRDKRNSFKAREQFKAEAEKNEISLKYNDFRIGKTRTQCTNARIQSSAATLTKKAMGKIFNDKVINDLGFRLLIPVHDELLGECPAENAEKVSQRLSELMIEAAKPELTIKFKCDPYIAKHWYADEVENEIRKEYKNYTTESKKNPNPLSSEEAKKRIVEDYSEISENIIAEMIDGTYDPLSDEI